MSLSYKRQAFVYEYLKDFNATQAAIRAGYSEKTARSQGQRLLTIVDIQDAIQAALKEKQMDADEALALMSDIARGDMSDLMDVTSMGWALDMQKAKERGKTKLIKKVKQTTITKIGRKQDDDDEERTYLEVELYPADSAIRDILKHTKPELGSKDNPLFIESRLDDEQYSRAISTLADAVRESISGQNESEGGDVGPTE